jgi:hypothetical protein
MPKDLKLAGTINPGVLTTIDPSALNNKIHTLVPHNPTRDQILDMVKQTMMGVLNNLAPVTLGQPLSVWGSVAQTLLATKLDELRYQLPVTALNYDITVSTSLDALGNAAIEFEVDACIGITHYLLTATVTDGFGNALVNMTPVPVQPGSPPFTTTPLVGADLTNPVQLDYTDEEPEDEGWDLWPLDPPSED